MMARVSGSRILKVEPCPSLVSTWISPPVWEILVRTTSMPTPRPEISVTCALVENPASKIRL
jgi:hypothetical protein